MKNSATLNHVYRLVWSRVQNAWIPVSAVHVTGNHVFTTAVLESLVADLAGRTHTLSALEAAAARITAYYRERGYFLANAYLPAQKMQDGVLQIVVLEGKLDQLKLDNTSRVSNGRVQGHLQCSDNCEALKQEPMDRQLLLLRETIGISSVHATLRPGASVGTTDMQVVTTPTVPYRARVQLDNYGNYYTGKYRIAASLDILSPLRIGDQLSVRAVASNDDMTYGRVSYQLPVGSDGLRLGAAYSYVEYELGKEFSALGARGTATSGSLFATYPFLLSQTDSLVGSLTYEKRSLDDRTNGMLKTDKQVQSINLGLVGNFLDTLNGAGQNSFDISLVAGELEMDAASRATDNVTARSSGGFTKANYMLSRLQRLSDRDTLAASLSGQWAGDNLNSSDKYSLGGPFGVRAYPQGEASGDEGNLLSLELRHRFIPQLQGLLFYDYGHVRINHNDFSAGSNSRTVAGAGFGINALLFNRLQLNSYLAWRTQGGTPQSEPASEEKTPRFWVQLGGEF
jgi:hemolysin activation/secretion protein